MDIHLLWALIALFIWVSLVWLIIRFFQGANRK